MAQAAGAHRYGRIATRMAGAAPDDRVPTTQFRRATRRGPVYGGSHRLLRDD
jgi:hypothetical protein